MGITGHRQFPGLPFQIARPVFEAANCCLKDSRSMRRTRRIFRHPLREKRMQNLIHHQIVFLLKRRV